MDIEIIPTYIGIIIAKQNYENEKPGFLSFKKGQHLHLLGLDNTLSIGYATSDLKDPFGINSISGYMQYNMFNTIKGDLSLDEYYNNIGNSESEDDSMDVDDSEDTSEDDSMDVDASEDDSESDSSTIFKIY